jgi:hypothetical protein
MKQMYMAFLVIVASILIPIPSLVVANEPPLGSEAGLQAPSNPDIQWFKEELHISPKYIEEQEGILGMSFLHLLLMLFLFIFFLGALVVYYRQTSRTKRILQQILSGKD